MIDVSKSTNFLFNMKRDQHKIELKNRVLKVSSALFIQQGYSKTTIKEIIKQAHITTGSLYHFFKNKEDILLHITRDVFTMAAKKSDIILGRDDDPYLRLSLEIALQLSFIIKYERLAEIYYAAYNSWQISRVLIQMGSARNSEIFKDYKPDFAVEDYYTRTLAIKGILQSFIDEMIHYKKIDDNKRIVRILELILLIFNIPVEQIKKTITKTEKKIRNEHIKIYGFEM